MQKLHFGNTIWGSYNPSHSIVGRIVLFAGRHSRIKLFNLLCMGIFDIIDHQYVAVAPIIICGAVLHTDVQQAQAFLLRLLGKYPFHRKQS